MVHRVRLGDEWRDFVEKGEDGFFLAVGVVGEDFVEELEALYGCFESWSAARRTGGGSVDGSDVGSERVVNRQHPVDRTVHDYLLRLHEQRLDEGRPLLAPRQRQHEP